MIIIKPKLLLLISLLAVSHLCILSYPLPANSYTPAALPSDNSELWSKPLPKLSLSIAPQYIEHLETKREQATKLGFLMTAPGDFVPGVIQINNQPPVNVRVRLKGDLPDHFRLLPYSLRVNVKKGNKILGMSKFSLQRINTRLGHFEAIYLKHLRQAGILSPRYFFVDYYLNNRQFGAMAVEEHFTKELLESQGRRESVILAIDESIRWEQENLSSQAKNHPDLNFKEFYFNSEWLYPFKCFQAKTKLRDNYQKIHYQEAVRLIRGYKFHSIFSDQVFDMEMLAKYMVLSHFWVANHSLGWPNIRIYYNPITRLFEPIGFDNQIQHSESNHLGRLFPQFFFLSFSNQFIEHYHKEFYKLKKQIEEEHLLEEISGWEKKIIKQLKLPPTALYPYQNAKQRINYMAAQLPKYKRDREKVEVLPAKQLHLLPNASNKPFKIAALLIANYIEVKNRTYLEIANITNKEVLIDKIYIKSKRLGVNIDLLNFPEKISAFNLRKWNLIKIDIPKIDLSKDEIHVIATYDEHNARHDVKAKLFFAPAKKAGYQPDSIDHFLKQYSFIHLDNDKKLLVTPGTWKIKQHLIVPTGYTLQLNPGTTLLFDKNVRLVLRGALRAQGSPKLPIKFSSINPLSSWAGIVVLKTKQPCHLSNIIIQNIQFPDNDDWALTGALTFYETDVTITRATFTNNATEDSLNIVRSTFNISDVRFSHMSSDAIDIDFGKGIIVNAFFNDINGDAIDVSGSRITAQKVNIKKAGDKAISVGEASTFSGEYFKINDVRIAIACKDGSKAMLANSEIKNVHKLVYTSYIKKPEYSPAVLKAENNQVKNYKKLFLAAPPCDIFLDGQKQKHQRFDVKKLYNDKD